MKVLYSLDILGVPRTAPYTYMWQIHCAMRKKKVKSVMCIIVKEDRALRLTSRSKRRPYNMCLFCSLIFIFPILGCSLNSHERITTVCSIAQNIVPSLTCIKLIRNFSPHIVIIQYDTAVRPSLLFGRIIMRGNFSCGLTKTLMGLSRKGGLYLPKVYFFRLWSSIVSTD